MKNLNSCGDAIAALVVSVSLCASAVFTARADLLLYDGFATVTDGQNRLAYLSTSEDHPLQHGTGNGKSLAWTTGFGANDWWSDTSAVVNSFPNKGLSLPAAFSGTGDQFTARGGGAGYHRDGTPGTDTTNNGIRCKNRKISSAIPNSGKLYYRCLMQIDSTALDAFKGTSWKYVGTGISTANAANAYDNQSDLINNGIRIGFTGRSDQSPTRVDIGVNIGGQYTGLLQGITAGTTYIVIVELDYDNGAAKAYAAPIANYDTRFAWTVENLAVASTVTASAMNVMFVAGHYQTGNGYVVFDEIAAGTELSDVAVVEAATSPVLGDVSLSRTGAATYSISAEVLENAADTVSWIANDGTSVTTNAFATAVATNTTASGSVSGLAADKTWRISVLAENASGSAEKAAGTLYTGELTLGATTNALEYGLVPGCVVVSRAAADPFPLTVNYTISGSAGTEGATWVAPGPVTIPANESSAVLPVVPLLDGDVNEDVTITVALAAGNYEIPAAASKTLALVNLAAPAEKKTWIAAADGLASDGANWAPSGAPTSSDGILFDGNFSNARCTWDSAAGHAVASWTQTAAYTGTVDFDTTYDDGDFPVFAIAGDATVNGGKWTHRANAAVQTNRLSVTVGGDLTVGTGVEITATGKGYSSGNFPSGSACGVHGGSVNDITKVYGDLKHPTTLGSGGGSTGMAGGGAIHLVVAGDATVDGTLSANPTQGSSSSLQFGAGGSIYLQAASVAGSGSITAAGSPNADTTHQFGAGGRVAVVCTVAESLSFPKENLRCNGSTGGYAQSGGGGTIFVKTASTSQQNGTLIVTHNIASISYVRWWPTKRGVTPIPAGESWTLDSIEFRGYGVLCVPEGTSLSVPLSGVSQTSGTRTGGILYEGGTLDFGSAPYTLSGNWTFQADAPYTFDGDVTVQGGANIGGLAFSSDLDDFAICDVTVEGDLTIAAGGYASTEQGGGTAVNGNGNQYPHHGGQTAVHHSGNRCYGSVFRPALPGSVGQVGDHATFSAGGGALRLSVSGDMVVDGNVSSDGTRRDGNGAAAGGSVDITAATLSGAGSISAKGLGSQNTQWGSRPNGAGGRIAVRVTGEDIGTTGIWAKFAATGCASNTATVVWNQNTSAGTIYLQGKSDGEKGGTIYVKNQASYDTSNVATWIPAATRGDGAKDFAKAKLVIADRGVVAVGTNNLAFASISIAENSKIDLNGKIVKVKKAYLNGVSLGAGEYTADNSAVTGYVVDSVGGGKLIVGGGFSVVVR